MRNAFACLLIAAMMLVPSRGGAQSCAPTATPLVAHEVSREAESLESTAAFGPGLHRPTENDSMPSNVIEFVVDTSGRALPHTFRVLHVEDGGLVDAARAALSRWRFQPAVDRGCRVPQVTQWILRG